MLARLHSHWKRQKSNYLFTLSILIIGFFLHIINTFSMHQRLVQDKANELSETILFQRLFMKRILSEITNPNDSALITVFTTSSTPFNTYPVTEISAAWLTIFNDYLSNDSHNKLDTMHRAYEKLESSIMRYNLESHRHNTYIQKRVVSWVLFYSTLLPSPIISAPSIDLTGYEVVY